jgi:putative SOS response-associated peptidase YedK
VCGRYTLAAGTPELVEAFDVPLPDFDWAPSYNVAPGQDAPVVAQDRHGRRVGLLTWGLIPGWKDEPGKPMINARSESILRRPSFREGFERRRCLIPADGFYEWKHDGAAKLPFWIHPASGGLLSLAGIWDHWTRPGQEARNTFAILTMDANDELSDIHDRMPAVIDPEDRGAWLARTTDGPAALALLRGGRPPAYDCRPVSTRVNRTGEDDATLLEAVER